MTGRRSKEIEKVRELIDEILMRVDDFTFDQLCEIENGIRDGFPIDLIRFCARPEIGSFQVRHIFGRFSEGKISLEQIQKNMPFLLNEHQIEEILNWLQDDLDFEKVVQELGEDFYKVSPWLIRRVRMNFTYGLSWEKIREFIQICKEKNFIDDSKVSEIRVINEGILAGLTREEIEAHIKPEHNCEQIEQIIEELIRKKEGEIYKSEEITSFIMSLEHSERFDKEKELLRELKLGFVNGLTVNKVKIYATMINPHINGMRLIRLHFQAGYPEEQVRFLARLCEEDYYFAKKVSLLLKDGLPFELVRYLVENGFIFFPVIKKMRKKLRELPKEQIGIYSKKLQSFIETCQKAGFGIISIAAIIENLPIDRIEIYFKKVWSLMRKYKKAGFKPEQITEIVLGHLFGLAKKQIEFYASHEFTGEQMREIRLAYLDGLSQEEIEFLANPEFEEDQMRIIRLSFKYGLPFELIRRFAKPECDLFCMQESFLGYFWGLSEELIEFYMDLGYYVRQRLYGLHSTMTYRPEQLIRISLLKGLTKQEIETAIRISFSQVVSDYSKKVSLEEILKELVKDKKTRAKIRTLADLKAGLRESWKIEKTTKKWSKKSITL